MSNAMSPKSSSYSRASEIAEYSDKFLPFSEDPVSGLYGQLSILKQYSDMRQSVFRAELLQTMTRDEIKHHSKILKNLIEKEVAGLYFKLSFHLQGDNTEKSSHIHLWGDAKEEAELIIQKYIYENNLTVEENNNISFMEAGKKYDVTIDKIIETVDNKDEIKKVTTDAEELFYAREDKEFEELMKELDESMQELRTIMQSIDESFNFDADVNIDEIDISIIDEMLNKKIDNNINLYDDEDEEEY